MPRRGENIRKRKDGRWEARYIKGYSVKGSAVYKSVYGATYKEVKKKRSEKLATKKISFEHLCDLWLSNAQIKIKSTSISTYYRIIHAHILPDFKNNDIVGFIKSKSHLAPKTIKDICGVLFQIINYGQKRKLIDPFCYDVILPRVTKKELNILTPVERIKLVDYVMNGINRDKLGFLVALYTGIRIGELCALKWSDIRFETRDLSITKTIQRITNINKEAKSKTRIAIGSPKSQNSIREIPIPSFLLEQLKRFREHEDCYLLSGTAKYIEPRNYQAKFKRHLVRAGIKAIPFHTLRHTFATMAIEQGFDIKTLSEILGHSSVRITLDLYVHPSIELKRQNMDKLIFTH